MSPQKCLTVQQALETDENPLVKSSGKDFQNGRKVGVVPVDDSLWWKHCKKKRIWLDIIMQISLQKASNSEEIINMLRYRVGNQPHKLIPLNMSESKATWTSTKLAPFEIRLLDNLYPQWHIARQKAHYHVLARRWQQKIKENKTQERSLCHLPVILQALE